MASRTSLVLGVAAMVMPVPASADQGPAILSELRTGVMLHDAGIITNHKENGADANLEVLFTSPRLLDAIGTPRPHLGASVNTLGLTDQAYAGLTWHWDVTPRFFGEFSFGPGLNNGKLNKEDPERKALGSPVNLRESLSAGWQITAHNSLSVMFDHISNGGLARYNGGMDGLGLRWGYRF